MTVASASPKTRTPSTQPDDELLTDLTERQRAAVLHEQGPLLILAGAGTGKTTVITRRIAWLITTKRARPDEILALTFTDKAAVELEERVDVLVPYGYMDIWMSTFHAFGDRLLRDHALEAGLSPDASVLSKAEQLVFLKTHLFALPLARFRPLPDPARYVSAIATVIGRAKDEAVKPEEFLTFAQDYVKHESPVGTAPPDPRGIQAMAECYAAYQELLRQSNVIDFGDQVLLAITLLEEHPEVLAQYQQRFRYILVDEFQDTNYAQFRLLELLAASGANITVVGDDDQSIYKWRGAALSNVLKFLEHYPQARRVILTDNFRSTQPILDHAYRLIRFNDPDRLEVKEQMDKKLVARAQQGGEAPQVKVFDTASSEADWVAQHIQQTIEGGGREAGDFAILVRSNREADLFLRALNVSGIPWQFSGVSGLFARADVKMLLSCLKALADPHDTLSWYHVLSSTLYDCPMEDLTLCTAQAARTHRSLREVLQAVVTTEDAAPGAGRPTDTAVCRGEGVGEPVHVSGTAHRTILALLEDVRRLVRLSRTLSPGQLLYRWLSDSGWLKRCGGIDHPEHLERLQTVARFFDQLRRFEDLGTTRLPELMRELETFRAFADAGAAEGDPTSRDRVSVLTLHKAKGLEFPVVFLVGLVQGRFPTRMRRDPIELPEALIKDILPSGDYHLQEERRLFYVGMTRAKEILYLTAARDYGGRTVRKQSQFVLEAMNLTRPMLEGETASSLQRIQRAGIRAVAGQRGGPAGLPEPLRLSPHGVDDYLTCPLKFRYSHVLRLPLMRHHLVVYGTALHKAIEVFLRGQLEGRPRSVEEVVGAFDAAWRSEGFLTREHEERRLARGREVLRRFVAEHAASAEIPTLVEEKFMFHLYDLIITGRWDRVDGAGKDAVIIDYKSSDVETQREADRRVRDSLQMGLYALAWRLIHGVVPRRLELRFPETGLIGQATVSEDRLEAAKHSVRQAAAGIRARDFHAEPREFSCRWCAYQSICPSAATIRT